MANFETTNQVLTEVEAAEFLRLSRQTLWQLRKARRIEFHKAGKKILYRQRDLENFLSSVRVSGAAA